MMVTPYFYPKVGGLENYAFNIAQGLKKEGHEVFVVTSNHKNKQKLEESVQGLRVIRLPRLFKLSNTPIHPMWYWRLKKIIKSEKPDIINAHTPVPGLADMAVLAAGKVPVALTCHAAALSKEGNFIFNVLTRVYAVMQLSVMRKADSIITVSHYVKECLPQKYQSKTFIVPNAIDVENISKKEVIRKPHRLIFIGSLDHTHAWKGLSEILEAIQIVKKSHNNIELLILGDGNMRVEYEKQAKELGIEDNLQFHGSVTGQKKYKLIKSASAMLVYPTSSNDAFPTVLLEAWACCTPILAADIGAIPTLVNSHNGLLVEPKKPRRLAEGIAKLLDKPQTDKITKAAYAEVLGTFNWPASVMETQALFKKLKASKSLLYITNFPINDNLAPSIHVLEVCNNLAKLEIDVCLIAPNIKTNQKVHFSFKRLSPPNFLFPILYQMYLLPYLIYRSFKSRPDVFYVRQEAFMFAPSIAASLMRIPMITEVNGLLEDEVMADDRLPFKSLFKKIKFFYMIERHAYKTTKKIITVTDGLRDRLIKKYGLPKDKVIVIENGVNLDQLQPLQRKNNKLNNTIGYVGGLSAWQGLSYVIEAMPQILSYIPSAKLVIYGEGQESLRLQHLVNELQISRHVSFRGSIDHQRVNRAINSFDICVAFYTKDREGLNSPFKIYEYLACGKPVIVSDVQAIGDKFEKISVVARAEDANDFAQKAVAIMRDRERQDKLSKTAREYIIQGHTWSHVTGNISQVISSVS